MKRSTNATLSVLALPLLLLAAAPGEDEPGTGKDKPEAPKTKGTRPTDDRLTRDRDLNNRIYRHLLGLGTAHPLKPAILGWRGTSYPDPVLTDTAAGKEQKRRLAEGRRAFQTFQKATGRVKGVVRSRWLRRLQGLVWLTGPKTPTLKTPDLHPILEHIQMEITPPLLTVIKGSTVDFINRDKCRDNIMCARKDDPFTLWFTGPDQLRTHQFKKAGASPLLCKVHPDEWGTVLVLETPFFATTDRKGNYLIPNVPPGEWVLHLWHPKLKPVTAKVKITAGGSAELNLKKLKRR